MKKTRSVSSELVMSGGIPPVNGCKFCATKRKAWEAAFPHHRSFSTETCQ